MDKYLGRQGKPLAAECDPAEQSVAVAAARGEMLVVNKLAGAVSFFACGSNEKLGEVSMPKFPHEVIVAPDGRTAYVSIYGHGVFNRNAENPGREIMVIDLATRTSVGSIDVSPNRGPHGMAFDRDGLLWVSCDVSGRIIAVDTTARKVVAEVNPESFGTHWLVITPDGGRLYASNKHFPFVAVVDIASRTLAKRIPLEQGSEGLALAPDAKRLYVMSQRPHQLHVIDTTTDQVCRVVPLEGISPTPQEKNPQKRVKVAPDGRHVIVSSFNTGEIVIAPVEDLANQSVVTVEKGPMGITFIDAGRAYVLNHDQGSVSVIDVAARKVVGRFETAPGPETLALY